MKEFIKLWLHNAGKLTLVILAIINLYSGSIMVR